LDEDSAMYILLCWLKYNWHIFIQSTATKQRITLG